MTAQVYNVQGQNNAPFIPQGASPVLTTNVPNINFQWGSGSVLGGPSEDVIVRFTGSIISDSTQDISFMATGDDGTRLYIDGALITNDWYDKGGGGSTSAPISFTAGVPKTIELMYYENGGGANVFLHWNQSGSMAIVPASAFTSQSSADLEKAKLAAIAEEEAKIAEIARLAEVARLAEIARLAEVARLEAEAAELLAAKQEAERQALLAAQAEAARVEAERQAAIAAEQARLAEIVRQAAIKAEAERIAKELAAKKAEEERIAAEQARLAEEARLKAEAEAKAAEEARIKAEAEAKAKAEEEARIEAERIAAEKADAEQREKERLAKEEKLKAEAKAAAEIKAKQEAEAKQEADRLALIEKAKDGKELTSEQKDVLVTTLLEQSNPGQAISSQSIADAGLSYKDLPPATPVDVRTDENGNAVVISAEVAAQVELLQDPGALLETAFSDPGAALQALGSIGADMSQEEREEATDMVIATVVAAGAAINAAAVATGGATGGSTGGGGSSGGGSGANSPGSRGGRRW